jgi:hypothetical protein
MDAPHSYELSKLFWAKVDDRGGPDACWYYTGPLDKKGYGQFWINRRYYDADSDFDLREDRVGKSTRAHRYAYEDKVGEIPFGLTIDHCCHNVDQSCVDLGDECPHRKCVNYLAEHIKPEGVGQNRANAHRDKRLNYIKVPPTHCPQGHPYTEENTGWAERRGHRERRCKACYQAENYLRKYGKERPGAWDQPVRDPARCKNGHLWSENERRDTTTGKRRCRACERINDARAKTKRVADPVKPHLNPSKG